MDGWTALLIAVWIAAAVGSVVSRDLKFTGAFALVFGGAGITLLSSFVYATAAPLGSGVAEVLYRFLHVSGLVMLFAGALGLTYLAYGRWKIRRNIGKRVIVVMEDGTIVGGVLRKPTDVSLVGKKVKVHTEDGVADGVVRFASSIPDYFLALETDKSLFLVNTRKIKKILREGDTHARENA